MSRGKTIKVSIYGIGNFGYAMLKHFDGKQHESIKVTAYDRNQTVLESLKTNHSHPFFHKSVKISDYINFARNFNELLDDCDVLILAVSSDATREVAQNIKPFIKKPLVIVNTAKALDYQTGKRLSEIVDEELREVSYTYALVAGGTIAQDLFKHEPLGIDLACSNTRLTQGLNDLFTSNNLHVYSTTDLIGVEYAAAFKNIIAILAGIVKGLGFSYGSETHLISRTAQQVADIAVNKLGAQTETFSTGRQCWGNDLWMSCTGNTRNREFGILLGKSIPVEEALAKMTAAHKTIEGYNTVKVIDKIDVLKNIEIINLLHQLIIKKTATVDDIKQYLIRSNLRQAGSNT